MIYVSKIWTSPMNELKNTIQRVKAEQVKIIYHQLLNNSKIAVACRI